MDRVAIIGGTGFIGDYLTKILSKEKNLKITSLYRNTPPEKKISKVTYLQLDACDFDKLKETLVETSYLIILSRPDKKIIQNVTKLDILFKKIIYSSTLLIYPDSEDQQDENTKPKPANLYEQEKLYEEKKLKNFAKRTKNFLTIARLTNVYGDIKNRALIHWIFLAIVKNQAFLLNNSGKPVRDFIFIEDVVEYLKRLILLPQRNNVDIFNISTGVGYSIDEVITEIEKLADSKQKIMKGKNTSEKSIVIGNNKKIIDTTSYKPRYTLRSGLLKTYKNYKKNVHKNYT